MIGKKEKGHASGAWGKLISVVSLANKNEGSKGGQTATAANTHTEPYVRASEWRFSAVCVAAGLRKATLCRETICKACAQL